MNIDRKNLDGLIPLCGSGSRGSKNWDSQWRRLRCPCPAATYRGTDFMMNFRRANSTHFFWMDHIYIYIYTYINDGIIKNIYIYCTYKKGDYLFIYIYIYIIYIYII